MGLSKVKLGEFIEQCNDRNTELLYSIDSVRGISTDKNFIKTKANLDGVNLASYKIVNPNIFAYVADTSRRGNKIAIAFNNTKHNFLISSIYTVFKVHKPELSPYFLFMYFNRPEFDRYARFNSWGSARETFDWADFCDIELELPPIDIQQKYVAIYSSMLANQQNYERGLEDLKLTCDAYIENLRRESKSETIGKYLMLSEQRNDIGLNSSFVRGLAVSKQMIPTKANMNDVNLNSYKLVPPKYIAYVADTSRRGDKMSLGFNDSDEIYLVSSISTVFLTDSAHLLPKYLMLYICRNEFDRYARFHSWGSARETFDWDEMCNVKIPIPDLQTQQSIVNIYNAYMERKKINEQLKEQIRNICPILIKGSLEEAKSRKDA